MQEQELGRSKGGFSTKIHASCDALGNPLRFFITAGQRSDYVKALELIEDQNMDALIADKGYDADYMVEATLNVGGEVVIYFKNLKNCIRNFQIFGQSLVIKFWRSLHFITV